MTIVVREHISWWSKLKQSFVGFLLSFVIVIGGLALLAWNEHRTLKTYKGLKAAGDTVVVADASSVNPSLDGKLIYLSAEVNTEETARDPDFDVEAPALVLRRSVEMYQWKEKKETKDEQKLGGGTERVTTYSYERVWDDDLIDSGSFREGGHRNPDSMPYQDAKFAVSDAHLGAYQAGDDVLDALNGSALQLPEEGYFPNGFQRVDATTLYAGDGSLSSPQIGDLRVRFEAVPVQFASVIAQAQGDGLVSWASPAGTDIFLAEAGKHDAAALVDHAQSSNSLIGWLLRGLGFVLLWVAFSMMLGPLATLTSVLPPLGRAVGAFTGMVAFVIAAVLASVTIVLSWIFVRPLWAVSIVLAIVAVIAMWSRKGARTPPPPAPLAGMPPPPPPR
jgi:hypothetical protein